jgi:phosphate transport system substrate-binding protein
MISVSVYAWIPLALALPSCAYMLGDPPPSEKAPAGTSALATPTEAVKSMTVRLRGSSTVGLTLAPKLAVGFLHHEGAADAKLDESGKAQNRVVATGHVGHELVSFVIEYPGSKAAFECLGSRDCDVGMSSRPVTADEEEQYRAAGDLTSEAEEHVVAMDGIAVVLNRTNRVAKLTVGQIGAIFSGAITNWSQVDGNPGPIHRYIRDTRSGTYESFVQFALGGKDIPTDGAKVMDDNDSLSEGVSGDEAGIGFVGLPFVRSCKAVAVQDGEATPLAPTPFTVASEDYAFSRRLFLYTPDKTKPTVSRFLDYALSDEGQKVVTQTGFVSLSLDATSPAPPPNAPDAYTSVIQGRRRLSFTVHFRRRGAMLPDGKALRDIARLSRFLRVASSHAEVALFGFADNGGPEVRNIEQSEQRAKTVSELLKKGGVDVKAVVGLGSALAVAPNATPEGRNKNRRVEVWVK